MNDQDQRTRPGRWWYCLAVVLFVSGLGLFVWSLVHGMGQVKQFGNSLQRVVVPGGGVVSLGEPGQYQVYYEPVTRLRGRSFNTPQPIPAMTVKVRRVADDKPIKVKSTINHEVYHINRGKGVSEWQFQIAKSGKYRINAKHSSKGGPKLVLGVGRLKAWELYTNFFGIFGGAAAAVFGTLAAVLIGVIVFIKRRRAVGQ